MHARPDRTYKYIRISKYPILPGLNNYRSMPGISSNFLGSNLRGKGINEIISNLTAQGFWCMDYISFTSLLMLVITKYARLDTTQFIGLGYQAVPGNIPTGGSDLILGLDGRTTAAPSVTGGHIVCFGIEDLWGFAGKYRLGMWLNGNTNNCIPYIQYSERVGNLYYSAVSGSGTIDTIRGSWIELNSITITDTRRQVYITDILYDIDYPYAIIPSNYSTTSTNKGPFVDVAYFEPGMAGFIQGSYTGYGSNLTNSGLFGVHFANITTSTTSVHSVAAMEFVA